MIVFVLQIETIDSRWNVCAVGEIFTFKLIIIIKGVLGFWGSGTKSEVGRKGGSPGGASPK